MLVDLKKSTNPKKKYMVIIYDNNKKKIKTIHFGAAGMSDFTLHKDLKRQKSYLDRHRKNENWNDILTAGAWSRWLLWNKNSLDSSKKDISKRFNIKFI